MTAEPTAVTAAAVELYWIPLGAGGHCVRFNGRIFEALDAARRAPSALRPLPRGARRPARRPALHDRARRRRRTPTRRAAASSAPAPSAAATSAGCACFATRFAAGEADRSPTWTTRSAGRCRLTTDPGVARRLLDLVAAVPRPVWGRDELDAGEMWNSNSVIAWLVATAGLPADELEPAAAGQGAGLEGRSRGRAPLKAPEGCGPGCRRRSPRARRLPCAPCGHRSRPARR